MLKIARRVFFYERGTDRAPDVIGALEVARKLKLGQLKVRAHNPRTGITAVESSGLSVAPAELGARPGSFGIHRERIAPAENGSNAGIVFSHHKAEISEAA